MNNPGRALLLASLYALAGVIKGKRLFWDAVDDVSCWFVNLADAIDPGCDDRECDDEDDLYIPDHTQVTW